MRIQTIAMSRPLPLLVRPWLFIVNLVMVFWSLFTKKRSPSSFDNGEFHLNAKLFYPFITVTSH